MARRPLTDEDLTERAAIDGRIVFAMATFAAMTLMVALLDRIGIPEALVRLIGPLFVLAGLATLGVLLRSMRVSRFYGAGRTIPTPYVGLGAAALAAGLALPFVPPAMDSVPGLAMGVGAAVGFCVAALATGPYLRKTGAFSLADLVAARFPNIALRLGLAVTIAAIGALIGMAGYETAVAPLIEVLGISRPVATAILAFVLVLIAAPGGLSGVIWSANGAAGVLFAAFALPLFLLLWRSDMPMPFVQDPAVWREAGLQILVWQGAGIPVGGLIAGVAAAIGVASLAPLLSAAIGARDSGVALRGGILTIGWGAILTLLVTAALLWGTVTFSRAMAGQRPERLPDNVYAAAGAGLVEICGGFPTSPTAARTKCAPNVDATGRLPVSAIKPLGPFYLIALSGAAGLGAAGTSLLAAALLAIGLALAAAGFLICATALGHDLFYRVRDHGAQASRRLAITRAILVAVVAVGAGLAGARDLDPRILIGLAMALSAAGVFPLIVLSMWSRALGPDAVVALLTGLGSAEAVLSGGAPSLASLSLAATTGAVVGTGAGFLTSFLHGGDRAHSEAFVAAVLHSDGDVLAPDKGA
jgi:cation/acetate symporter